MIRKLINRRLGREDEPEADRLALHLTTQASYDPRASLEVMRMLEKVSGWEPKYTQTLPGPDNRIAEIERAIQQENASGLTDKKR